MSKIETIGAIIGLCMFITLGVIFYGFIGWAIVAMLSVFIPSIPVTFGSSCAAGGLTYVGRWLMKR